MKDTAQNIPSSAETSQQPQVEPLVQPQVPQNTRYKYKGFAVVGVMIVAIVLILGLVFVLQKSAKNTATPPAVPQPKTAISTPQPTLPRSKAPGVISNALTAKAIDPKTGEAVTPTSTFASTDKSIYLVLTLKNPKVGSRYAFTRYLNGKFLDNGSLPVTKLATNNVSFVWALKKAGATHPAGNYKVKVYTNGIFEKEISYTVQ